MSGISAYKQNAVTTQSPGKIVIMLYNGAIRFLYQSLDAMEKGDVAAKGKAINKACDIITELSVCLDMEVGGEIAKNLRSLYEFMLRTLTRAHLKNDPDLVRKVIDLLEELNQGWKAIAV
jgi:flagellar secretion chaperone FliS